MGIFYVYLTNKNQIIFKLIRHDNHLNVGQINTFGHLLIYKSYLSDGFRKNKVPLIIYNRSKKFSIR